MSDVATLRESLGEPSDAGVAESIPAMVPKTGAQRPRHAGCLALVVGT